MNQKGNGKLILGILANDEKPNTFMNINYKFMNIICPKTLFSYKGLRLKKT